MFWVKTKKNKGALFIEAALVLPLFLYIIINMIYMCLLLHDYLGLNNLTRNAVRYAAVEKSSVPADGNGDRDIKNKHTNVNSYINNNANDYLILYSYTALTGESSHVTLPGSGSDMVSVSITVSREPDSLPLIAEELIPVDITSTLKMRMEDN